MKQGSIYLRGNVFWISYSSNGRKIRESSHSTKETDAGRLLRKRLGELAEGKVPGVFYDRVRWSELAKDLRTDYRVNGRKSADRLELSLKHLQKDFASSRVVQITPARIAAYIEGRLNGGAANGSINRELTALKRALNLGKANGKVAIVPHIAMLAEHNVRQGFFEADQFRALLGELPEYLKAPVTFAYYTGMRRGEVLNLRWSHVNLKEGYVRLEASETKTGHARTLYLAGEALEGLKEAHSGRRLDCSLVFHREGKRIVDFRKAWSNACTEADCPGMLFHDLRRTAVRNMVRANVPERVAMQISGHKTRSVFDRYNIVSDKDLREAAEKVADYLQAQNGHNFGHSGNKTANLSNISAPKTPG